MTKPNHAVGFLMLVGMMFSGCGAQNAYSTLAYRFLTSSTPAPVASVPDATPSSTSSTGAPVVTTSTDSHSADRDSITSQYAQADAAYSRRNAAEHMAYMTADWSGIDAEGNRETRADSERYYALRFSDTESKRFASCSLDTTINSIEFTDTDHARVKIVVIARNSTITGERRAFRVKQTDFWSRTNGSWKCSSSRTTFREKI